MTKKLFSISKNAEKLLDYEKKKGTNISSLVSQAVVDEMLPVYSSLRAEAFYLLELYGDDKKLYGESKVKNSNFILSDDEVEQAIRRSLSNAMLWLKQGHYICDSSVLKEIIDYFQENTDDDKNTNAYLGTYLSNVKVEMEKLITALGPSFHGLDDSLYNVAKGMLMYWRAFRDEELTYHILSLCILHEKMVRKMDIMDAIRILQKLENQVIIEKIK